MEKEERKLEFAYWIDGAGWADAELKTGDQSLHLTASYLTDALPLLLRAVEQILDGAQHSEAYWAEEPGCYRWILTRTGDDLRVQIFIQDWTHRTWPLEPWRAPVDAATREVDGEIEFCGFDCSGSAHATASALVLGASKELLRLGELEYWEDWGSRYPKELLWRVEDKLGRTRTTPPPLAAQTDDPFFPSVESLWRAVLTGKRTPEDVKQELKSDRFAHAYMSPVVRVGARTLYHAVMFGPDFARERDENLARFNSWMHDVTLYTRAPEEWLRRTMMQRLSHAVAGTRRRRASAIARDYREYLAKDDIRDVIKHRDRFRD